VVDMRDDRDVAQVGPGQRGRPDLGGRHARTPDSSRERP
jgi:hypothetical protein